MWHLSFPKSETLTWYKGKFLSDIELSIKDTVRQTVKEKLLPGGSNKLLETLLIAPPDKLYALSAELETDIKAFGDEERIKAELLKAFDYNGRISRNKSVAYELAKRIGTRTCVYCNRIYSFTVESDNGATVVRPDFDHWLPKEQHPLLSMSFFNLIPSCPLCNRSIKLRNDFEYGKHVHPYQSEEERQFSFQYEPLPGNEWQLKLAHCSTEESATAEILKTEDVYSPYANSEVKDILDFAYVNPPEYLLDLKEKVMKSYGGSISKEQAYRLIFGTEMNASLFLDRPLSKMKWDVLKQLQEALKIDLISND